MDAWEPGERVCVSESVGEGGVWVLSGTSVHPDRCLTTDWPAWPACRPTALLTLCLLPHDAGCHCALHQSSAYCYFHPSYSRKEEAILDSVISRLPRGGVQPFHQCWVVFKIYWKLILSSLGRDSTKQQVYWMPDFMAQGYPKSVIKGAVISAGNALFSSKNKKFLGPEKYPGFLAIFSSELRVS